MKLPYTKQQILSGDYIPRGEAVEREHALAEQHQHRTQHFAAHKQRVLESVVARMRTEKQAGNYRDIEKIRPSNRRKPVSYFA